LGLTHLLRYPDVLEGVAADKYLRHAPEAVTVLPAAAWWKHNISSKAAARKQQVMLMRVCCWQGRGDSV
jgi:hypothetical protein